MQVLKFILVYLIVSSSILFSQNRYTDSLFKSSQTDANRVFASAPELNSPYTGENSTHSKELVMHIYQPENDTLSKRPMLIAIHGGAFVSGTKENEDMMEFCRIFATKGYVTATMDYRLGMNVGSSISAERAVYRGLQDGRAAVRFVKEIASELRIDTNNVYLLGSSAGSFVGLFNLFMNEESERPASSYAISNFPPTINDGPDLGALDAIANNYKHSANPKALISCWGALKDTSLIKLSDSQIPVLLIHGSADNIVPFGVGSPFNLSSFPPTYGSSPISKRLENLNFPFDTYFVPGEGHEFYGVSNGNWDPAPNAYWDTVVTKTTNFMWKQHKPMANFTWDNLSNTVQFNNHSANALKWNWDFGDGEFSEEQNPIHVYAADGNYKVSLFIQNYIDSWDTVSATVVVQTTGVNDRNQVDIQFSLKQNYPNPFNPSTIIEYSIPHQNDTDNNSQIVSLVIYDLTGRKIATLVDGDKPGGKYRTEFNLNNFGLGKLSSGVYLCKLQNGNNNKVIKMILLK